MIGRNLSRNSIHVLENQLKCSLHVTWKLIWWVLYNWKRKRAITCWMKFWIIFYGCHSLASPWIKSLFLPWSPGRSDTSRQQPNPFRTKTFFLTLSFDFLVLDIQNKKRKLFFLIIQCSISWFQGHMSISIFLKMPQHLIVLHARLIIGFLVWWLKNCSIVLCI